MKTLLNSTSSSSKTGKLFHSLNLVEKERDLLKSQCIALRNKLNDSNNLLLKLKENSNNDKLTETQKELQHSTKKYQTEIQALTKELEITKTEYIELKKQINAQKPQICYQHEDTILVLEKEVKEWQMKYDDLQSKMQKKNLQPNYELIIRENQCLREREKMLEREIEKLKQQNCKVNVIAPIKSDQLAINNVSNDNKIEKPFEDIIENRRQLNKAIDDFLNDSFSNSESENENKNDDKQGINKTKEEKNQKNETNQQSSDNDGFHQAAVLTSLPLISEHIDKNEGINKPLSSKPFGLALLDPVENDKQNIEKLKIAIPSKEKPDMFSCLNLSLSDSESEDEKNEIENKNSENDNNKVTATQNNTNEVQSNQIDSLLPTIQFSKNSDSTGTIAFSTPLKISKNWSLSSESEEEEQGNNPSFLGINGNQYDVNKSNSSCKRRSYFSPTPFPSTKKKRTQSLFDINDEPRNDALEKYKKLNISIEQEKEKLNAIQVELIRTEEQFKAFVKEEIIKLDSVKENTTKFLNEMAKQEERLICIKMEIESLYKNFSKIIEDQKRNCVKIGRLEEEQEIFNLIKLDVVKSQKKLSCMEEELKILKEENGILKTTLESMKTKDKNKADYITIQQASSLATKIARTEIRKQIAETNLLMKRKLKMERSRLIKIGFKRGKKVTTESEEQANVNVKKY